MSTYTRTSARYAFMTKIRSNGIKGDILLLLAAFIYGSGLVAQKAGMNNLGPLTFTAIRFILGGLALLPVVYILEKHKSDEQRKSELTLRQMLPGCFISGINLVIGVLAQQYGLPLTTVGKAGFITGLYVILTPIAGVVILRRKIGVRIWLAAIIAVAGFYFLSLSEGFGMTFFPWSSDKSFTFSWMPLYQSAISTKLLG